MATSSASLDRSPKKNWVENAGGLPPYIRKIARAIHEKRGIPLSQAIPFAIGRIKRWAAGGDNVTAATQAKAAAAIAAWERLKGKAGKLTEAATIDENLGIPTPLLLRWVDELDQADALVEARRHPRRLPDGTFAPLGTGSILAGGHDQMAGGEGTIVGLVQQDGMAKVRVRTARGEFLVDPDSLRPVTKRKLVEAGAAGSGAPARMTASRTGRARAGAVAARKRPAATSTGGSDFESKHPRGGKGSTAGGKFVAKGSSGSEVRAVQRRLGARVDGEFGAMTEAAVKRFQQKHGLTVDGVIGRQTVAALRGRKDAKRVKIGGLSKADRDFLSGHVRGKGRRRRSTSGRANATSSSTKTTTTSTTPGGRTKTTTTVVEAVAAPALLARVRALELGEVARLADGGAVKHHASDDGRELWTVGRPTSYGEGVSWGEQYRTPGEAVGAALTRSAGSSDPASLGGATRFGTSARVTVNGMPARFYGVTPDGLPAVTYDGARGEPVTVTWPEIAPAPRLLDY